MHDIDTFQTARLAARRVHQSDFDDIFWLHTDPRVVATLGGPRSEQQTRQYLQTSLDHWDRHGFGQWMFDDRTSGDWVGRCGLRYYSIEKADVAADEIELLYALRAEYWGRGLASEMAQAALRLAFERLKLPSVVAFTLHTNRASQRVMEKCDMRYERDITHANLPHVLYRAEGGDIQKP